MGCFSYICKNSGKAIKSSSFDGDFVHLFLLIDGEVVEEMFGKYDSYGRVFDGIGSSFEWKTLEWGTIVDLHFNSNTKYGISAILAEHYNNIKPTTQSEDDPNQGWGDDMELLDNYSDINKSFNTNRKPYHKVYNYQDKLDKLTSVENTLKLLLLHNPMLNSKLDAYIYLLVEIGNGIKWLNGSLHTPYLFRSTDKEYLIAKKLEEKNKGNFSKFSKEINDDILSTLNLNNEDLEDLKNRINKSREERIDKEIEDINNLDNKLKDFTTTNDLSELCIYSNIMNIPKDVKEDWLKICEELLGYLLNNDYKNTEYLEVIYNSIENIK